MFSPATGIYILFSRSCLRHHSGPSHLTAFVIEKLLPIRFIFLNLNGWKCVAVYLNPAFPDA